MSEYGLGYADAPPVLQYDPNAPQPFMPFEGCAAVA